VNVCVVCQADGVLIAAGHWYCVNHVEDGFIATAETVARILGHDEYDANLKAQEFFKEL
jgi:hypothetical protein